MQDAQKAKSVRAKSPGDSLETEDGEEAEDSSSSSSNQQNVQDLLDNFRKEWRKELRRAPRCKKAEQSRLKEKHDENTQDDEETVCYLVLLLRFLVL